MSEYLENPECTKRATQGGKRKHLIFPYYVCNMLICSFSIFIRKRPWAVKINRNALAMQMKTQLFSLSKPTTLKGVTHDQAMRKNSI